jgi:multidrug efflux pump subunit AcrA (membrane-fusion protein)
MSKTLKNTDLKSNDINEIITKMPNNLVLFGNIIVFITIMVIIILTWFIKYPDIIKSEAMITTSIPPQKIYSNVTSKIDTIFVKDKQKILPNQPISILINSADYKSVYFLKAVIDTLDIQNDISDFILINSMNWALGEIEVSFSEFESNYLQYQLYKKLNPFSNEVWANSKSLLELNNQLTELNSQHIIYNSELNFRKNKLHRSKLLFDKGIISASEYEKEHVDYLNAEGNSKNFDLQKSQIKTSINNVKNVSRATIIERENKDINLYKETLQSLQNLKRTIKDWEMKFVLQSDISGTVSFLDYWAEYQTVNKNHLIFTVTSDKNSEFIAKLKTPVRNSGKIKIGQRVNITLLNYPEAEFGSLIGNVKSISSIPDENGFYLINVSLPEKLITTYNQEIEFKQEMRGHAEIITEDLRLIEKIFHQVKNKMAR